MFFRKKKEEPGNKRNYDRMAFVQVSYFRAINSSEEQPANECWFNNISVGGFSIDTRNESLTEGDTLMVLYKIGTRMRKDQVIVKFVRRVLGNWRCGCEFINDDIDRTSIVLDYIESNLKK